nr:retrovirus-related Pol polyprotein from transposon TNT 1-94 [Tanacetum cinerariifolium]
MTEDRSQLRNFMKTFTGTVRFRNDHFGSIMGSVQRDKKPAATTVPRKKHVTFVDPCETSTNNTLTHVKQQTMHQTNEPAIPSTGVNGATAASGSKPMSNTKKDMTLPAKSCSKYMTGDRSRPRKFMKKFIGTVRFENDHFGAIMGYGDYMIGDSVIFRVYYVEGLRHDLFSVRQFYDFDLKHSCYVRDTDGVELIKGSRGSNLYTIPFEDMIKSFPICLLSKASKTKSWLWHRRLNHLNFGTINDLARKDLLIGLPRLKFEKDHLCSACQLGKSKKHTYSPKTKNTNLEVLNTLHIDLCGPMRVQKINGKKYILVIVDDYTRFTWVKFLRSKDKTPEVVATACYTQNRSLIHIRHNKTPYKHPPDSNIQEVHGHYSKIRELVTDIYKEKNMDALNGKCKTIVSTVTRIDGRRYTQDSF